MLPSAGFETMATEMRAKYNKATAAAVISRLRISKNGELKEI